MNPLLYLLPGRHDPLDGLLRESLLALAAAGRFPAPTRLEIHTGARDAGCDPALATRFAAGVSGARLMVYEHQGHRLDGDLVRATVADFLRGAHEQRPEQSRMSPTVTGREFRGVASVHGSG